MAIFKCCSCCREQKGEICYHDNQVQLVLPSLLLLSALSQLFLVAVAISIAVDSYRNYAKGITIFIFFLNLIVIMLGLIFVLKGWNTLHMEPANIVPIVAQPTPSNETDSLRNLSVEHLSYLVSITTIPANKASTQHSVLEKRDFHGYKKSCRDLILLCATVAFPVDGLLTVSLILLFIFSIKIKGTEDISQGLHDDESPLLESIEKKHILKEE
ncbi:hypothetical protein CHS0354_036525 [Potamilus streckersoni]|uniref:Uncharacterized protein n=1 Tax=Potamilus streckersoni TaxID=2493646 RepID=A0AAE0VSF6_9BIVA|nr:hypothetical protein CHS0354_036525 [Potamilus streckersoni]